MESHSDLPPTTRSNAQIANAAQVNHPPYSEMITTAIVAMKERDGSSRQAIAKYIEGKYNNLSPSHATLLTQQLRKMRNQGQLVMNKRSYMLSGSRNSQPSVEGFEGSVVTNRRPGRPPKIQSNGGGVDCVASPAVSSVSGPPMIAAPDPIGAVPTVVPMGEVDGRTPVKRRPGRPHKLHTIVVEAEPGAGLEAVSIGRRLRSPPKVNNVMVGDGVGVGVGKGGSMLGKRGRGRVVKKTSMVSALVGSSGGVKRGRGRPRKMRTIGLVTGQGSGERPSNSTVSKQKGRPRKNVAVNFSANGVGGAVFVPVVGMGGAARPSQIAVRRSPRKFNGKPLGRSSKDASAVAIQSSNQQQSIPYQQLKERLEHFQSKVKHAVGIVKPYITDEVAPMALGVLQEVEGLALMDLCAPDSGGLLTGGCAAVTVISGAPSGDQG